MMATKTKRKLIRAECKRPPVEIRENTKARRAWLETYASEVNARPNREAKIVGKGSYQEVSVYEVSEVEGRLRFRGVCQFCGHSQVVGDGVVLVLHGYTRPGDGYIFGRCPGVALRPLNAERVHTDNWLAQAIVREKETSEELSQKALAKHGANRTLHDSLSDTEYSAGYKARPVPIRHRRTTPEQETEYKVAHAAWVRNFPEHAAVEAADLAYDAARQAHWQAESNVRHFQMLLDSNIYGSPLTEEVVT